MITIDDFKANTKEWLIDKLESLSREDALQTISNLYNDLHKSKYPKTYKECCEVLVGRKPNPYEISFDKMALCLIDLDNTQNIYFQSSYLFQLDGLFRLLICRNVYWKIAGEEMGLDIPWEPDWCDVKQLKFGIHTVENQIKYITLHVLKNLILVFPTEEMRDAFYENFKDLIEQCKELL